MEDRGVVYDAARDRLIGWLSEVARDIDALRAVLDPLATAETFPDFKTFHDRLKDLARRIKPMSSGCTRPRRRVSC